MNDTTTTALGTDNLEEKTDGKAVDPGDAYVLVVEDNLQNLVLIARLLAFLGVRRYEWKASGWQVLEFADTMPQVDLVLMDIHLPYEDGYDALHKLRGDPRFKWTRVVAITADANPASMEKARQAGFDGFLGKPIDPDKFPDQIRRILQGEQIWDLGY
jgi:two-component system cell cycle response regulator DivK